MIIDAHIHITEPVSLIFDRMNALGIDRVLACSSGLAKGEQVLDLNSAQIVMSKISKHDEISCDEKWIREQNEILASVAQKYPDKIWVMGKVDLTLSFDQCIAELDYCLQKGFKGLGEIVNFQNQVENLELILSHCNTRQKTPFFFHCDYPVARKDIVTLCHLAKKYHNVPIILGHLGGDFWQLAVEQSKSIPNILLDSSEVVNMVALRVAIAESPEKVIFSSDYPWEDPEVALKRLECLKLPKDVLEKVLGKNILSIIY